MSRNLLESLIIVLIALTFGVLLVMPKYNETLDLQEKDAQAKTDLKNKNDYFEQLKKIDSQLKNYSDNLTKIKTALPDNPEAPALANFVQSASSQSGLILKNLTYGYNNSTLKPAAENAVATVQALDMQLSLSGSYPAFKDFLSRIEKSSRLIEVQEITFTVSVADKTKTGTPSSSSSSSSSPSPASTPASTSTVKDDTTGTSGDKTPTDAGANQIYEFMVKLKTNYY